jgi:hypothetical protein
MGYIVLARKVQFLPYTLSENSHPEASSGLLDFQKGQALSTEQAGLNLNFSNQALEKRGSFLGATNYTCTF